MDLTTSSAPAMIFPVLKNSNILECLEELGIDFSKTELLEPAKHREKLRQVFTQLLWICAGKTEEDFEKPLNFSADSVAYPDLHDGNFNEWNFFEALQQLMSVCGYYEFSWRDLYHPEPKRLRFQLSAIINLAKFRESQLQIYAELREPRDHMIANLEELKEENAKLHALLEEKEQDSAFKSQEMQEVINECEELELEITRKNRQQAAAREEAAVLKKQANELADQLTTAGWALEEAQAEEENLRHQIVSSPDRRLSQVSHRREQVQQVKDEAQQLEKEIGECKGMIVRAKALEQDVKAATEKLKEVEQIAMQQSDLENECKTSYTQLNANEKRRSETQQAIVLAERELNRVQEMAVYQKQQQQVQQQAVQEAIDAAKASLLQVEKDRRLDMSRVQAGEAEVLHLQTLLENKREEMEATHRTMRDELEQTAALYFDRLEKRCQALETVVLHNHEI
ncbi:kinetochore protein Nuf2 [Fistulifera solaris]|uniref:Kinetochore protein Nuf2 n=1 Tax=Fistulifera solaris TaxID=1519565 RepID=A0A1Z5JXE6_FISSO|nr:kinetochore protein Nuf2 [Fistulifera solaris]|eukprot:GAX18674.1 kinetochore protein Nuf2 [Fistulifera solaris]